MLIALSANVVAINIYSLFNYYLLFLSLQRVVCANMTLFDLFCFAVFKQNDTFCDSSRVDGFNYLVLFALFSSWCIPYSLSYTRCSIKK